MSRLNVYVYNVTPEDGLTASRLNSLFYFLGTTPSVSPIIMVKMYQLVYPIKSMTYNKTKFERCFNLFLVAQTYGESESTSGDGNLKPVSGLFSARDKE
jgi:hypothetical protein